MCYQTKQTKTKRELEKHFKATVSPGHQVLVSDCIRGYDYAYTPVIRNETPSLIEQVQWGLIPEWAKDEEIQAYTLNARIETLTEKPSFKEVVHQRCLILCNGFYEWQWQDAKGKLKQKYEIGIAEDQPFALAGLWSTWQDPKLNTSRTTYTIITTEANTLMATIHNTKKRMPVILPPNKEKAWLQGASIEEFGKLPVQLEAKALPPFLNTQTTIF